jgi:hypothetical protein
MSDYGLAERQYPNRTHSMQHYLRSSDLLISFEIPFPHRTTLALMQKLALMMML